MSGLTEVSGVVGVVGVVGEVGVVGVVGVVAVSLLRLSLPPQAASAQVSAISATEDTSRCRRDVGR